MRALDFLRSFATAELDCETLTTLFNSGTFGLEPDFNPFSFDDFAHRGGNVFIIAGNQPVAALHHGDPAAEAAIHLANSSPI